MNRNHTRLLNDQQIKDITVQAAEDLKNFPLESAEHLMNFYLNGDADGMFKMVSDWIEIAEDAVIEKYKIETINDEHD